MRLSPLLALGGLLFVPCLAMAQWGWGWGPSYHSSTAEEGIQRGAADMIRSAGMKNLMNSEAAKNLEQARSKNIDNRLKWTKTYFEMKRVNREYREANRRPRPTSEQLFRLAKQGTPGKLTPEQLDPVTGKVNWPRVLQQDEFARPRQQLDELYALRAQASDKLTMEQLQTVKQNIEDMQIILKRNIDSYPPQVFSSANAFLKSLEFEARQAMM